MIFSLLRIVLVFIYPILRRTKIASLPTAFKMMKKIFLFLRSRSKNEQFYIEQSVNNNLQSI
ncbi:hypothetical protein CRN72_01850 [Pasteurella multocida]|nr:hypothetical protein CO688_01560 [Pasteurella multocida]ATN16538.1 hypothetical protein CRN72_01850 [Pasteurella multocida]AWB53636.1 hypothetical protein DB278_08885 [Pasteurella multocida]PNM02645.1 hypothetical protein A6J89_002140 [Pasteurella multocida]QEU01736.1 hypothetical protein FOB52_06535 [Pasteurella multocida]